MNRLQKKCFLAATGFHLLLLVILFVGPGFLSSTQPPPDSPPLEIIPDRLVDAAVPRSGNPDVKPPAPQPQPPAPQLQPQARPPSQQSPPIENPQPPKPLPDPADSAAHKPQVSTTPVTRPRPSAKQPAPTTPTTNPKDSKNPAKAFSEAARRIKEGTSSSTTVALSDQGSDGPSVASYAQAVQAVYKRHYDVALLGAGDIADGQASVEAAVTILRDGTVISAKIVKPSGNPLLDKLVKRVLETVGDIAPFPEGAKDSQRTFNIIFDLKPRKAIG